MVNVSFMKISNHTLFAFFIWLVFPYTGADAEEVKIAVASNFIDTTREIAPLFEKATGHTTRISHGSTGKLYSQIAHGAPFEIFMAADSQRPIKAEEEGLAVPATRFVYARGKLVLWSLKPALFTDGERYLKNGFFDHLSLANSKTAPYGLAAEQVMRRLGVLERLRPKLVRGESISQAFQFVATGNAELGFVALAQIKDWEGEEGTLWQIPTDFYAPIDQAAVLLKKGADNPAAIAYLEFLKSDVAREVIERYGYGVE
ncbi:MAG: molybdate ABC transporter substrate-binding protein [Candidatus Thiodiazotropha endolucinida]|nr:molybdate ABC transporter substrate-binding protein [Candidatus Thiodiazotropha endolucinida]